MTRFAKYCVGWVWCVFSVGVGVWMCSTLVDCSDIQTLKG